ncbi:DUF5814 domain-containing protein [Candidatus Lokiarchaeum ossiferum]|uniref:DUF5814 domain-containing protein n=1 Tax=Candidatus Lokiarchaeum ossiferum TaxID=2951803 RepID=UPI00352C7E2C
MSPSLSGILQRKKYFSILDKDEEHPKKPFFDVICFELIKDDVFYGEIRYLDRPFFTGLVLFDKEPEKETLIPFKFWKRNLKARNVENQLKPIDPTEFRNFILNATFIIAGNHLNKPQGHNLEKYQVVETDAHEVQQHQMDEYLKVLQPIYDYCSSIQYSEIRNYLFCHSCKQDKKYTLIDEKTRYKNQAFYVCKRCAGKEVIASLKQKIDVSSSLKTYLRDLLLNYRDVVKVINVFNPNFNILDHREATLVGVKKKKIKQSPQKPQSIYDFSLPAPLKLYYQEKHRTSLLPAQIMALENGLLERQDELVVSATSSGKTMIGELAGISKILEDKIKFLKQEGISNPFDSKDTLFDSKIEQKLTKEQESYLEKLKNTRTRTRMLYVVPIVALANMRHREYAEFKKYGVNSALKVGVSHISRKSNVKDEFGQFGKADVVIATYEAIDILLRSSHPHLLRDFRTIVIDEIQMLADAERGFILDGMIARLRLYLPKAQFLYLSATISDPKGLAKHLRAALVHYTDRPVELERHLVMCIDENAKMKNMRNIIREEYKTRSSFGFRGQTIVFTNSRKNTEKFADFLRANHVPAYAYHGGLEYGQRKFVEKSFEMQKIACVVTTAALAAGVDFPASNVIFFNLIMGIQQLTVAEFEQMSGRAGRLKKHDKGTVYLLVSPGKTNAGNQSDTEEQLALKLLKGKIEPLKLEPNEDRMFLEVLAIIAMYSSQRDQEHGISKENLQYFHAMMYNGDFDLHQALIFLHSNRFIKAINNNTEYRTTRFGQATAESFFSLEQALEIRKKLLVPVSETVPAPDMLVIAQHLDKFNNVYVTNRILAELSMKNEKQSRSNNFFSTSVLSMISADHLGKKKHGRINRRLYNVIMAWSEDIFNCACDDNPYCDCGKRNVEGFIFDYRLSGMSISEIVDTFQDEYEVRMFPGDIIDYLEGIIYALLSIQKIGKSLRVPPQTMLKLRDIPQLVTALIGPRKTKK